jgi:hypothetical protein
MVGMTDSSVPEVSEMRETASNLARHVMHHVVKRALFTWPQPKVGPMGTEAGRDTYWTAAVLRTEVGIDGLCSPRHMMPWNSRNYA